MKLVMDSRSTRPEASASDGTREGASKRGRGERAERCLMAEAASADNDINSDDRRRPPSLPSVSLSFLRCIQPRPKFHKSSYPARHLCGQPAFHAGRPSVRPGCTYFLNNWVREGD